MNQKHAEHRVHLLLPLRAQPAAQLRTVILILSSERGHTHAFEFDGYTRVDLDGVPSPPGGPAVPCAGQGRDHVHRGALQLLGVHGAGRGRARGTYSERAGAGAPGALPAGGAAHVCPRGLRLARLRSRLRRRLPAGVRAFLGREHQRRCAGPVARPRNASAAAAVPAVRASRRAVTANPSRVSAAG